jgi:hypothetical protein
LTVLLFFCTINTFGQIHLPQTVDTICFKNKVQSKVSISYDKVNPSSSGRKYRIDYDRNGRWVKRMRYESDGIAVKEKVLSTYDENGNLLTYKTFDGHGKRLNSYGHSYKYDKQNRIIESMDSNMVQKRIYKYDIMGHCIEDKWEGREHQIVQYKYDGSGKLMAEDYTDNLQGDDVSQIIYRYDEDRELIEKYFYYRKGDTYKKESYMLGKIIAEMTYYKPENKIITKTIYKYNDQSKLIESTDYIRGPDSLHASRRTSYEYNDKVLVMRKDENINPWRPEMLITKYNDFGMVTEMINNGYNKSMSYKITYLYNNGLLIEEAEYDKNNASLKGMKYSYTFYK